MLNFKPNIFKIIVSSALLFSILSCENDPLVKPAFKIVRKANDVLPVDGKWVKPVIYFNEFNFEKLPLKKKKDKFIAMLLPSILQVKHNLSIDRERIGNIIWKMEQEEKLEEQDSVFLYSYMKDFKAENPKDLYKRLATHPTSLVLAQAAIESGWGSSRFFTKGNNIFGIWSYNKDENRMKALHNRGEKSIFVRSYSDINGSIEDYFNMLARSKAYGKFREERSKIKDPMKLSYYLKNYSELRYTYVSRLKMVINKNNLTQYDTSKLDPAYYYDGQKILANY